MKIVVVGAGVLGTLIAFRLAEKGADVLIVEAGKPACAASGASFGWINASYFHDADHFRLRREGIVAHRRLSRDLAHGALRWQAALCWEESGAAFDRHRQSLRDLGYGVREVDRSEIKALEPCIRTPDRALLFEEEGVVDLVALTKSALGAAAARGARLMTGVAATGIATTQGRVSGLRWSGGVIPCDGLVLAAGVATSGLVADLGVELPMLDRPGLLMRSGQLPPMLAHVLVTPQGELRQDASGRILAPTAAAHQSDATERITRNPADLAARRAAEVSGLLQREVVWEEVALAFRPVPGDGLPVLGACGPEGLYVATMHSGATLAAVAAEVAAGEVMKQDLGDRLTRLVAPYRPGRFTA